MADYNNKIGILPGTLFRPSGVSARQQRIGVETEGAVGVAQTHRVGRFGREDAVARHRYPDGDAGRSYSMRPSGCFVTPISASRPPSQYLRRWFETRFPSE